MSRTNPNGEQFLPSVGRNSAGPNGVRIIFLEKKRYGKAYGPKEADLVRKAKKDYADDFDGLLVYLARLIATNPRVLLHACRLRPTNDIEEKLYANFIYNGMQAWAKAHNNRFTVPYDLCVKCNVLVNRAAICDVTSLHECPEHHCDELYTGNSLYGLLIQLGLSLDNQAKLIEFDRAIAGASYPRLGGAVLREWCGWLLDVSREGTPVMTRESTPQ